jgi:Kdo2-lipid IVA lauroyltransferase/acyltransferase
VGLFLLRERSIAELQLRRFLPEVNASAIARDIFSELGQMVAESVAPHHLIAHHEQYFECPDWHLIEEIRSQHSSIVGLTAHLGNWDLLGAYVVKKGLPVIAVGRQARSDLLQATLVRLREELGLKILWRGQQDAALAVKDLLREGSAIAGVVDQDTRATSIFSSFFGLAASTPCTLVRIAIVQKTPLVAIFLVRRPKARYLVRIFLLHGEDEQSILDQFHSHLENLIREYPAQWVWFHKRWRTRPEQRLSNSEYLKFLADEDTVSRKVHSL